MTKRPFFILLIVLILVSIVYINHFNNPFHFDDNHTIVNNVHIKDLSNIPSFFTDVSTFSYMPTNQGYRPIVTLSLAIDYALAGGLNPFFFHLSMFLWFLIQLILMYYLYQSLFKKSLDFKYLNHTVLFAIAWYGLHTTNAETINYIISRSDSISTMFVVAALLIYIRHEKLRKYGLYLIPAILGILTKQTAVVFFPILLIYILLFELDASFYDLFKKNSIVLIKKLLIKTLPALLVCLAFGTLVFTMQRSESMVEVSNLDYLITQPWVMLRYFILFFLPVNLSADTDWQVITNVFDERVIIGFIFILLMIIAAFKTSKKRETRPISFGILWFFLALLPTSSFIALTQVTNDHRMFFPFVGLMISAIWTIVIVLRKHKEKTLSKTYFKIPLIVIAVIILGGNAYGTIQRNKVWSSSESLWYDVTVKSPNNARGLLNYGVTQMEKGNYQIALEYYNRALVIWPDYAYLQINLGIIKNAMGMPDEAEKHFTKGVYLAATHADPPYYYARFLKSQGRLNEAISFAKQSITISPDYMPAKYLLLDLYYINKDKSNLLKIANNILQDFPNDLEAKSAIKNSETIGQSMLEIAINNVSKNPSAENYIQLSLEYYYLEMYEECISSCYKSLDINPNMAVAYNNICSAYNRLGEYENAIEACNKALEIQVNYERAKNNLEFAKSMVSD